MLDLDIYQGADGHLGQVEEPGVLGLGGLVIDNFLIQMFPVISSSHPLKVWNA